MKVKVIVFFILHHFSIVYHSKPACFFKEIQKTISCRFLPYSKTIYQEHLSSKKTKPHNKLVLFTYAAYYMNKYENQ